MTKLLFTALRKVIELLPLGYMVLIWLLSSVPSNAVISTGLSFDDSLKETLHFIEFGILYFLWIVTLISWRKLNQQNCFYVAIMCILYGLLDELHQYFVASRSCSLSDFLKDVAGVLAAWYIVRKACINPNSKIRLLLDWIEQNLGRMAL